MKEFYAISQAIYWYRKPLFAEVENSENLILNYNSEWLMKSIYWEMNNEEAIDHKLNFIHTYVY